MLQQHPLTTHSLGRERVGLRGCRRTTRAAGTQQQQAVGHARQLNVQPAVAAAFGPLLHAFLACMWQRCDCQAAMHPAEDHCWAPHCQMQDQKALPASSC